MRSRRNRRTSSCLTIVRMWISLTWTWSYVVLFSTTMNSPKLSWRILVLICILPQGISVIAWNSSRIQVIWTCGSRIWRCMNNMTLRLIWSLSKLIKNRSRSFRIYCWYLSHNLTLIYIWRVLSCRKTSSGFIWAYFRLILELSSSMRRSLIHLKLTWLIIRISSFSQVSRQIFHSRHIVSEKSITSILFHFWIC